jgi:hypothetical protein
MEFFNMGMGSKQHAENDEDASEGKCSSGGGEGKAESEIVGVGLRRVQTLS